MRPILLLPFLFFAFLHLEVSADETKPATEANVVDARTPPNINKNKITFSSDWDLNFRDLRNGKRVKLKEDPLLEKSKALVFIFLSIKCPCSKSHLDHIKELNDNFPDFTFIGVHSNQDEPETDAKEYFKIYNLPFPLIHDQQATLADKYGALKTPHAFIIDPEGKILFQGGLSNSVDFTRAKIFHLQEALAAISEGKKPKTEKVKTIGCYIAR